MAKNSVSKVSRMNAALQHSLQALARDPNIDSYLGHLLVEMAHEFETTAAAIYLLEHPERRLIPHLIYDEGKVISGDCSGHPILTNPRVFTIDDPVWLAYCRNQPVVRRHPQSDTTLGWTEGHRAYYAKRGISGIVNVPLIFSGQVVGALSIQFRDRRYIDQETIELAQTFAPQATLALQLIKMAAQSKQIAIAKEQELFARQKAAELRKANEALRGCLNALASVPELDEYLGRVVAAITRQLGARGGALWLYDFEQNTARVEFLYHEDDLSACYEAQYPKDLRCLPLDQLLASDRLREEKIGPILVLRVDHVKSLPPPWPESHLDFLNKLGVKIMLIIPLLSNDQAIGRLTFRFHENREFSPEEIEISTALAHLAGLAVQLTRLARGARQGAILGERNRMAGEIHDSLAQSFVGIRMQLDAAEAAASKARSLLHIRRANELAQFGLAEARRSVLSLRSGSIEQGGLLKAIQQLVERSNVPGILRCEFRSDDFPEERLPAEVRHELLRICQEAVSNSVRHAKPTVITVTLRWNAPKLTLQVVDNGSGLPESCIAQRAGFGMASMRARAEKLGGTLHFGATAGGGTTITADLEITS